MSHQVPQAPPVCGPAGSLICFYFCYDFSGTKRTVLMIRYVHSHGVLHHAASLRQHRTDTKDRLPRSDLHGASYSPPRSFASFNPFLHTLLALDWAPAILGRGLLLVVSYGVGISLFRGGCWQLPKKSDAQTEGEILYL